MTVATRKPTKRERALELLEDAFRNQDIRTAGEMWRLCEERGEFSYRCLQEAKEESGIRSERIGGPDGYWQWRRPGAVSNGSKPQVLPATYNGALPAKRCECDDAIPSRDDELGERCLKCGSLARERTR